MDHLAAFQPVALAATRSMDGIRRIGPIDVWIVQFRCDPDSGRLLRAPNLAGVIPAVFALSDIPAAGSPAILSTAYPQIYPHGDSDLYAQFFNNTY